MTPIIHVGYRPHDHVTPWQECDTCHLRLGEGITTAFDTVYYAGDPERCPRPGCEGTMALPDGDAIDA